MKIIVFLPSSLYGDYKFPAVPTLSLPDSSILKNGNPFFIPDFDTSFSASVFTAVKITRLGKSISPRFAGRYYSALAPALNIHADNLLRSLREAGLPWNAACGFDKSLILGEFSEPEERTDPNLCLSVEGAQSVSCKWAAEEEIAEAIYLASQYNSLKMGDLILIPSRIDPIALNIGLNLSVKSGEKLLLRLPVK